MDNRQWQSVVEALRDVDNIDSAVAAAAQLQACASTEDIPRLIELLADESFFVREAAAWPLSDLGRVDLLPQLLAAYNRGFAEGHDNDGFSAALIDLVQSKPAESRARLSAFASSADPELRKSAAWCLEFAQEAHDAQQAVGADGHTSTRARRMCVTSLCTRGALDAWSRRRSTAALDGTDMFLPPSTVCGFAAQPRGDPVARTGASAAISLCDGRVVRATLLQWNFADFAIADPELATLGGWFQTIGLEMDAIRWHLSQGDGTFWTTRPELRMDAVVASEVQDQLNSPKWKRRSNRFWPHLAGVPLPFLGQGSSEEHHIYLFGDIGGGALAAHLDHRNTQDVEDHYDDEAERDGSAV